MSARPSSCSLARCKRKPSTRLYAVDGPFWFCDEHAAHYEAGGYRRTPFRSDGQSKSGSQLQISDGQTFNADAPSATRPQRKTGQRPAAESARRS